MNVHAYLRRVHQTVFRPREVWRLSRVELGNALPASVLMTFVAISTVIQLFLVGPSRSFFLYALSSGGLLLLLLLGTWFAARVLGGGSFRDALKLVAYSLPFYLVGIAFSSLYRHDAISIVFVVMSAGALHTGARLYMGLSHSRAMILLLISSSFVFVIPVLGVVLTALLSA